MYGGYGCTLQLIYTTLPLKVTSMESFMKDPPKMDQYICIMKSETLPTRWDLYGAFCEKPHKMGKIYLHTTICSTSIDVTSRKARHETPP